MPSQEATPIFNRSALAIAVSAACGGTQVAHAQSPQLDEIVVTATKREASLQDVPLAVTAFSGEDIVRQGFERLDDYVGKIPGLAFSRREPGGTTVLMRGCTVSGLSFGGTSTTSIYLDEQPITAAGRNPDVRLVDIERVEALSGPQGTLFGDASQCGSLRIITNKPDTTAFSSWVEAGVNQVADGDTGYDVSGMVNLPLVEDRVALRLVGFLDEEAGYVDNILAESPGGTFDNAEFVEEDVNSATNTGGRIALRTLVNDNWTVDATAIYQKREQDGFGDVDLAQNFYEGRSIGDLEQVRFNRDRWSDEWYQLGLSAEGSLGFADFVITGAYFDRETIYEADATSYQFGFNLLNAAFQAYYAYYDITVYDFGGDPQGAFAFNNENSDHWSIEARLSTPADSTSRWSGIVGLFHNREEGHTLFFSGNADFDTSPAFTYLNYLASYYDPTFPVPAPASGGNWFTGVYDGSFEQTAVFGEVGFEVTDNFNITVGGRFFDIQLDRTLKQGALFPVGTEPDCDVDFCFADAVGTADETGFVPKLTLDFHLNDDTMFYGTYSEGFRRGGANAARATSIFGPGQPLHSFDSDTMQNYELGLKGTWADGSFRLNAVLYHMIWEGIQLQAEDPDPTIFTNGIVNFPEAELDGAEAQFSWLPATGWNVSGTLGWNRAEISEDAVIFGDTEEPTTVSGGTPLPIMPDWKGSLSVEYRFAQELLGGEPYVRVDHTYNGEATSSLEGIQSIVFVNPVRTLDPYNITDLRAGIDADGWSGAVFVTNVFDERAEQFFNDRWAQTRLSVNRPLTFGVTYRKYFE
ncbi:MAG TPA: TonB-dependent receptor [Woeseiaceae bacterium]|nr:TonB-dependent receptor [Woeseiaceae bacterium]